MDPEIITLNRETHVYSNNLPSVTEILLSAGIIDRSFFTVDAALRGTRVHEACELLDLGVLDESSVDGRISGYLDAYRKFKRESGWEFDLVESPVSDFAHLYAGSPDRLRVGRPRREVDLKTGAFERWHPLQAAAYINCLEDPFSWSRFGLYLTASGDYKLREFPKTEFAFDLAIFQNALQIHYWKGKK
jgi:hypothetical protein